MSIKRVPIKQCSDAFEAACLADLLREQDIAAATEEEKIGSWLPLRPLLSRGAVLTVPAEDETRARQLLADLPDPAVSAPEDADASGAMEALVVKNPRRCPLCGSENIKEVRGNALLSWALNMLSVGLCNPPVETMWICRACDWDSRRGL